MNQKNELIEQIVDGYDAEVGMLIPMMQDIQAECGYLPAEHLRALSKRLHVPLSRLYAVATFYSSFRLAPKGAHEVTLCVGTVCYLKGAGRISEAICKEFRVDPGGTTRDRLFTFQAVNCVGCCAVAPVMLVDGEYHQGVTPESAVEILYGLAPDQTTAAKEGGA
jgi:NADH-quinone oxidoreductase subunit E